MLARARKSNADCALLLAALQQLSFTIESKKQKLLRNWTGGKHHLPPHQNRRPRKNPSKAFLWIQMGVAILGEAIVEIMSNALKLKRSAVFLAECNEKHSFEIF